MQVLVTGGAGFIGSHLAQELVRRGETVRVLDNLSTGRRLNLAGTAVEFVEGDVADMETVRAAVEGCELVFHQAALVSAPRSLAEPVGNHQVNVTGFFNVLEAARQAGARRVIYASSAAVYGNLPALPKTEDAPVQLLTPYAAAKRMNELYAATYSAAYGLETVGLRYMNVFGPRQNPTSPYSGVLSLFCRAVLNGQPCTIYGDGEQTRDFIFIADVVQALVHAAGVDGAVCVANPILNIGRGQQTSLNQIVALLGDLLGRAVAVRYAPPRPGDIRHSLADIRRARAALGFQPQGTIRDGLALTLAWFEQQMEEGGLSPLPEQ